MSISLCFFPEKGQFLSLDLWGNHFRVLLVTIDGHSAESEASQGLIPTKILQGSGEAVCFFMFLFCLVFAMYLCASVYMCFVVTCWERNDLLALVCGVYL